MNQATQAVSDDMAQLADDARALLTATADVAGEKVGEARKRLAAALDNARQIAATVSDQAIAVLPWAWSPMALLFTLAGIYAAAGFFLYRKLVGLLRNWQTLSAAPDQLRKDRDCLEKILA